MIKVRLKKKITSMFKSERNCYKIKNDKAFDGRIKTFDSFYAKQKLGHEMLKL